jgi:hypothetical protein
VNDWVALGITAWLLVGFASLLFIRAVIVPPPRFTTWTFAFDTLLCALFSFVGVLPLAAFLLIFYFDRDSEPDHCLCEHCRKVPHASWCAVHNPPAFLGGPCTCGAKP